MDSTQFALARSVKGFMPDDEGLALHAAGLAASAVGPLLEIGSYCGKSAVYLGTAARSSGTVLFTVDPRTGRMDTLPFLRRTLEAAGLEDTVIAIVGDSPTVARHWATGLGLVFIDGGHALDVAMADYDAWARFVMPGGTLAIHDVFEDPADGGQAPFQVWRRAVSEGFTPTATTGSLRLLRA